MPKMDVSPVFWVFYVDQKESFRFFVFSQVENFLIFSFIILDTGRVVKCTLQYPQYFLRFEPKFRFSFFLCSTSKTLWNRSFFYNTLDASIFLKT